MQVPIAHMLCRCFKWWKQPCTPSQFFESGTSAWKEPKLSHLSRKYKNKSIVLYQSCLCYDAAMLTATIHTNFMFWTLGKWKTQTVEFKMLLSKLRRNFFIRHTPLWKIIHLNHTIISKVVKKCRGCASPGIFHVPWDDRSYFDLLEIMFIP